MAENSATVEAKDKDPEQATLKSSRSRKQSVSPLLNMAEIRELAELVNEHGFTDFEFENENIRIRLSKMSASAPVSQVPVQHSVAAQPVQASAPSMEAQPAAPAEESDSDLFKITSPIVGTFYRSPSPDKEPYVKEGSQVTPDTVVCIVEAMKLMNEIQAETTGEVVKIYVENGQPVEYGQPLFGIRK